MEAFPPPSAGEVVLATETSEPAIGVAEDRPTSLDESVTKLITEFEVYALSNCA